MSNSSFKSLIICLIFVCLFVCSKVSLLLAALFHEGIISFFFVFFQNRHLTFLDCVHCLLVSTTGITQNQAIESTATPPHSHLSLCLCVSCVCVIPWALKVLRSCLKVCVGSHCCRTLRYPSSCTSAFSASLFHTVTITWSPHTPHKKWKITLFVQINNSGPEPRQNGKPWLWGCWQGVCPARQLVGRLLHLSKPQVHPEETGKIGQNTKL